ncbi:MAG: SUMF1/EgtB/PvdO family nonheme iron enzyme [Prolixibacteraceae bacterium]|nr:SUMF1/EgtB/PvdO family nonheme iron enzyme [Prolixibacteraceae bacterium]
MKIYRKFIYILLAVFIVPITTIAQIKSLTPPSLPQNEEALLKKARNSEPEILEGGYRQYELVVARLNTWENNPKDIIVRLVLPPNNKKEHFPLVAYVHGGGFIGGSPDIKIQDEKKNFGYAMHSLLEEGFAIASVGYRLAREAGWPAPISDVLCGLRFLSQHADHWGVDASSIGISGHSAGARTAVLTATVNQNEFHRQKLPWGNEPVNFAAIWLWAGSAWDWPTADQWVEFGKPRQYSVPRLLFGEHPAWDNESRHRLRIRSHLPHLSMNMPPLYVFRGASDYGGDHADAKRAVEVWKALGAEAEMGIAPGGHSTIGPVEPLIKFFERNLKIKPPQKKEQNLSEAARRLNDINEPLAAVEVLVQKHTTNGGHTLPPGNWMILHNEALHWNPDGTNWPRLDQEQLQRAQKKLAHEESKAAKLSLKREDWFRASTAAKNANSLDAANNEMSKLARKAEQQANREEQIFKLLHEANVAYHSNQLQKAKKLLNEIEDPRLKTALERVSANQKPDVPAWAGEGGIDVYGRWAVLNLDKKVKLRLRWVAPGEWNLPEHLYFRNRNTEPYSKHITIPHGFWLAETETTVEQWQAINQSESTEFSESEVRHPINMVNYLQIVDWLQTLENKHPELIARLPSESEWLFAATLSGRINVQPPVHISSVHALKVNPKKPGPLSVKTTIPNLGGFYGLLGGVMEWTASPGAAKARLTDKNGKKRVLAYPIARGGAWSSMPHSLTFGLRKQQRHGNRQPDLGFRIAIGGGPDSENWLEDVNYTE